MPERVKTDADGETLLRDVLPSSVLPFGSSAGKVCQGNDSRLTDERVPTAAGLTTKFGTNKATIADGDKFGILDSAASDAPKHSLWSLVKSTLKTYFDTLYASATHNHNASAITAGTLDAARLPVAGATTIGGVKRNSGSAGQYVSGFDSDGSALYGTPVSGYRPALNAIINGDMRVSQRGTNFAALSDATYCVDRWYALCETGTIDVVQEYADGYANIYVDSNSASSKFGVCQILENRDLHDMIGKEVTLSFRAACGPVPDLGLSAAICVWTGPDDAPTRDLVSSWNSSGANPTMATNWSIVDNDTSISPGDSMTMTSYTKTITLPGSINNLAVFIFAKNSANVSAGDAFYLTDVQLELGSSATTFQRPTYADSLARCQRYYEVLRYSSWGVAAMSFYRAASSYAAFWPFKVTKRKQPTVTLVTGSWAGGVPPIQPGIDHTDFYGTVNFWASGTPGNVALAANAEL